jgi:hypothetical protein
VRRNTRARSNRRIQRHNVLEDPARHPVGHIAGQIPVRLPRRLTEENAVHLPRVIAEQLMHTRARSNLSKERCIGNENAAEKCERTSK